MIEQHTYNGIATKKTMKRASESLLFTIERIVFGRSQSQSAPLLKREEFQLLPTTDEVSTSSNEKPMEATVDRDPITLEEFTDETVSFHSYIYVLFFRSNFILFAFFLVCIPF